MEKAIICDLDGTLFDCNWRRVYLPDFDKFNSSHIDDKINKPIYEILRDTQKKIIFVSGREEKYRKTTEEQLSGYFGSNFDLFMRKTGDYREDSVIKKEIYENAIKESYIISFVLDDRNSVVRMWRELGLICLQVADGNF